MTKPTTWLCAQRRLRSAWASSQSDQFSLCAYWVAKDPSFLHADSENSDQTGRMLRLIWVFAGRTLILRVLSRSGSIFTILQLLSLPRVNTLLVNGSCTCEQDLQLTFASPHVNRTIAQGNAIKAEVHTSISTYHGIPRQALSYARPYYISCHTYPGRIIHHAMPARQYHIPCHISLGHTICHAMHGRPYHTICQTSPAHTIYHAMPTRPYHIPCNTSPGHTIYIVMPYRPYHIPCHNPRDNNIYFATPSQANTYTMRYPPGHTIYHAIPPDHAIYHVMPARLYHIPSPPDHTVYMSSHQATPYTIPYLATQYHITMPYRPGHTIMIIYYILPCPLGNTIYHAMPGRPYHILCHAR